jgi:predicted secreted protein
VTNAIGGPGFLLQLGSVAGDGGTFTTLGEVKDITGPAVSLDVIDVTNQDSPGGYEEIIPSIRRAGEVTFDVNFNPADGTHDATTGLVFLANNKTKRGWRLWMQDEDDSYWAFDAYVTGLQMKAPVAGVLAATTTLRITGMPTISTGVYPT